MIMKKILSTLFWASTIPLFAAELPLNGDFSRFDQDGKVANWQSMLPTTNTFVADLSTFISPPAALKIACDKQNALYIKQEIELAKDTDYIFSCYLKADNIQLFDAKRKGGIGITLSNTEKWVNGTSPVSGSFDWKKVEIPFNSRSFGGGKMRIMFFMDNCRGGVCRIDDVKVTPKKREEVGVQLFPADFEGGRLRIPENMPIQTFLDIRANGAKLAGQGARLRWSLPSGVELIGAAYRRDNGKIDVAKEKSGIDTNIYSMQLPEKMLRNVNEKSFSWSNSIIFYLRSAGRIGQADGSCELQSNGRILWRKKINFEILPPVRIPAAVADNFAVLVCQISSQIAPFPEVRNAYLKFYQSLSRKRYAGISPFAEPDAVRANFKMLRMVASEASGPPYSWGTSLPELIRQGKIPQLTDEWGNLNPLSCAPWYAIEDPEKILWDKYVVAGLRQSAITPDVMVYNFEPRVWNYGYGAENRRRFAARHKITPMPSIAEIKQKYRKEWEDFRLWQHGEVSKRFLQTVRRHFPGTEAVMCCEPLEEKPHTRLIDARLHDNETDWHLNMFYNCGRIFFDNLRYNMLELKRPNLPLIDPTEENTRWYLRYSPDKVKQNIAAAAMFGCKGIGFFPTDAFDGRYFQSIADGFVLAAAVDAFGGQPGANLRLNYLNSISCEIKDGDRKLHVTYPDWQDKIRMLTRRKGDEYLVAVFNYDGENAFMGELVIPAAVKDFSVRDTASGKFIAMETPVDRSAVPLEVAPDSVVILRIWRNDGQSGNGEIKSGHIRAKAAEIRRILQKNNQFTVKRTGDAEISFGTLPDTGNAPLLKMQQGAHKLYINVLRGGNIVSWSNSGGGDDVVSGGVTRGVLGELIYHDGKMQHEAPYAFSLQESGFTARNSPYVILKSDVGDRGNAEAEIHPLTGLTVIKKITLSNDGRQITLDYTLKNSSTRTMDLGFRLNNTPMPGKGGESGMNAVMQLIYCDAAGKKSVLDSASGESTVLEKKGAAVTFGKKYGKVFSWDGAELNWSIGSGKLRRDLKFFGNFPAVMHFRSAAICTVEFLSTEESLPPGQGSSYRLEIGLPPHL